LLAIKKNEDGYIVAYVEYFIVNNDGSYNPKGEYCFVKTCWVHEKYRHKGLLKELIEEQHKKYPLVKKIYYQEERHNDRWKENEVRKMYD
jgi:hypothetical protein